VIEEVTWDLENLQRAASGSDLWPITWAGNGHLYTSWGDGGGFGGSNHDGRVSIGVARIEGEATDWQGFNVWGGKDPESDQAATLGKSNGGILAINGTLYLYVEEQDRWNRAKLWRSANNGLDWTDLGWILDEPDGAFSRPGIIQFGPNYANARDNYVYAYSDNGFDNGLGLFRVPKDQMDDRAAYEFFAGMETNDEPRWSANIDDREAVFSDPNGVGWGVNAVYHPVLDRYLMTVNHDEAGGWGIFDAPEPWGPWTTVAYHEGWLDTTHKFTFTFPQKWMSTDGTTLWMVFSGLGEYDSFNLVKGTLSLKDAPLPTATPTSTPTATPASTPTATPTNSPSPIEFCCYIHLPLLLKEWDQPGVNPADLITSIQVKSGKSYEQDRLSAGKLVYMDRDYTFTALAPQYEGHPYILTANDDKGAAAPDFLSFHLVQDATIYIAFDDRASQLPAWLEDWPLVEGTQGSTVVSNLIGTSDGWRRLYKKDFPAGIVTLGGNAMPPMAGASSNYSVFAVPAGARTSFDQD
jgi:hypothetical protein